LYLSCQLLRRQVKQLLTLEFRFYSATTNFDKCHYEPSVSPETFSMIQVNKVIPCFSPGGGG
jgi:hypothetical protein